MPVAIVSITTSPGPADGSASGAISTRPGAVVTTATLPFSNEAPPPIRDVGSSLSCLGRGFPARSETGRSANPKLVEAGAARTGRGREVAVDVVPRSAREEVGGNSDPEYDVRS